MSERLTDVELDEAMDIAKSLRSLRLVAALAELKERRALDGHGRRSDEELIQRRKADLSPEEVEALEFARDDVSRALNPVGIDDGHDCRACNARRLALAVLSKLTKAGR